MLVHSLHSFGAMSPSAPIHVDEGEIRLIGVVVPSCLDSQECCCPQSVSSFSATATPDYVSTPVKFMALLADLPRSDLSRLGNLSAAQAAPANACVDLWGSSMSRRRKHIPALR